MTVRYSSGVLKHSKQSGKFAAIPAIAAKPMKNVYEDAIDHSVDESYAIFSEIF